MYSVAFIFEPGELDDEFHSLNKLIQEAAESTDGYIGQEFWLSPDRKKCNTTYYWRDGEALKEFSKNSKHLEAKRQYSKWYNGYQVVVSEVRHSYGDGKIVHATSKE